MADSKKRLKSIKEGALSRGFALAKVSMSMGARAASHAMGNLVSSPEKQQERLKSLLMDQVDMLARELGQLKGSLMKAGQTLSMLGEHFLPPEVNSVLKSLQSQSPPLEWPAIEKVLKRQLGEEKLALLEIDPEPYASASLGQVHRARRKSDGAELAMKIQYPGVDKAIEGDLRSLRSILNMSKLIPKGPKYDELFNEVRMMLHQEVDYGRELALTDEFREELRDDPRFVVPLTYPEFSSKRVLTTSFQAGIPIDGPEVKALPLERLNWIGEAVTELFLMELFEFGKFQSDPHFGNYRYRMGENGAPDQIVLLDFGAVRKLPKSFLDPYREMVSGIILRDFGRLERGALELGYLRDSDPMALRTAFAELCYLILEPCSESDMEYAAPSELYDASGAYMWGKSDLPKRVAKKATQVAIEWKLRAPPRETVFLDRKTGGLFIFLSVLDVHFTAYPLLKKYLFGS